jgi:hypothetical protein
MNGHSMLWRSFLAILALTVAVPFYAAQPGPLPAFHLSATDGHAVAGSDLPAKGKWIILYIAPHSHETDRVLSLLSPAKNPGLAGKVAIIVAGSVDETRKLEQAYPNSGLSWFADANKEAASALKLNGSPMVLGLNEKSVRWVLNGVLQNGAVFRSVVDSWLNPRP